MNKFITKELVETIEILTKMFELNSEGIVYLKQFSTVRKLKKLGYKIKYLTFPRKRRGIIKIKISRSNLCARI